MDAFLAKHWDPLEAPVAARCRRQGIDIAPWCRINVSAHGVHLQLAKTEAECLSTYMHTGDSLADHMITIAWNDVLGARLLVGANEITSANLETKQATGFTISTCPEKYISRWRAWWQSFDKSAPSKPRHRELVQWSFDIKTKDEKKRVTRLVMTIQRLANPCAFLKEDPLDLPKLRRNFLVLINPVGGAGLAQQLYDSVVAHVFEQSGIDTKVIVTQYQAHATEVAATLPLDLYDCVVGVGGDGLLSEIVQGLMQRPDWKRAIHQPLGLIPGGSGNGLVWSLLAQSRELLDVLNATYMLAKGIPHGLDISTVTNGQGDKMYSFLTLSWGTIADIDVDSEKLRIFGGFRFTMSGFLKVVGLHQKKFPGKLQYLASDKPPQRYEDLAHKHDDATAPSVDCFPREDTNSEHWEEIQGDFQTLWAMNVTHAAVDAIGARNAFMDDGMFHIMCVPKPMSRYKLACVLWDLDGGGQLDMDCVQVIRTRAFSLYIDRPEDVICVDGERFSGPHIQVEVHRCLGRIVCLPRVAPDA